jgi:hypothetical protein
MRDRWFNLFLALGTLFVVVITGAVLISRIYAP